MKVGRPSPPIRFARRPASRERRPLRFVCYASYAMRLVALFATTVVLGCSPVRPESTDTVEARIIGGAPDSADSAIVAIRRADGATCSAVVVASRVVITAGHCVWASAPADLTVLLGDDLTLPSALVRVTTVELYPTATASNDDLATGVDLAALETATDLGVSPLAVGPDTPTAVLGARAVSAIGFGRTSPFDPASARGRQHVVLPIARACDRTVFFGDAASNVCSGDSGGAVVLDGALFAIVSGGVNGCSTLSLATRLAPHRAWFDRVMARQFGAPCPECLRPDATCVTMRAEPSGTHPASDGGCVYKSANTRSPWLSMALYGALISRMRAARRPRDSRRKRAAS